MRVALAFAAALFALFPLTDTDIWWHLACSREWVETWTPVREPVVHGHEFFQQVVGAVYGMGGAPLLVVFKALLWGAAFALFASHSSLNANVVKKKEIIKFAVPFLVLFLFRYQMEIRPVIFSLLFLGIYWNVLPKIWWQDLPRRQTVVGIVFLLLLQWLWCKFQGLYILGPLFACAVCIIGGRKNAVCKVAFVASLLAMPFFHKDGLSLAMYPFELLDRLMGVNPSASIFASQIAENRSPWTLLMAGENFWTSLLMLFCSLGGVTFALTQIWTLCRTKNFFCNKKMLVAVTLLVSSVLALVAERNFVLCLPVFISCLGNVRLCENRGPRTGLVWCASLVLIMFTLGLWCKSLREYDGSFVAYQRVPVSAAKWMAQNPHNGRLFNDDRAGGYLAFMNPEDSIYVDGRFMLKSADFFERYLRLAEEPEVFVEYADSIGIDRAVFPLRYYARWNRVIENLEKNPRWTLAYRDEYFCVFQK